MQAFAHCVEHGLWLPWEVPGSAEPSTDWPAQSCIGLSAITLLAAGLAQIIRGALGGEPCHSASRTRHAAILARCLTVTPLWVCGAMSVRLSDLGASCRSAGAR